jgi:hypothetical protein
MQTLGLGLELISYRYSMLVHSLSQMKRKMTVDENACCKLLRETM